MIANLPEGLKEGLGSFPNPPGVYRLPVVAKKVDWICLAVVFIGKEYFSHWRLLDSLDGKKFAIRRPQQPPYKFRESRSVQTPLLIAKTHSFQTAARVYRTVAMPYALIS